MPIDNVCLILEKGRSKRTVLFKCKVYWEDGSIRVLGTVFHFQAPDDWEERIRLQDLTS